ncbi:MAG: Asp-tRNA(Asn)/Glu-tRNA(Gln) amidotransferase subunit GatC [Ancalomicrobiaceae bacterium]|nr:Asp-tRNA(Asn)/Glu-tRNA(Gln) amidotransferase subunit GatC [Ancalomicrobiaceae bacterium]
MSVDSATITRVAHLARIAVDPAEVEKLGAEFNSMLGFVEQLASLDVSNVEPMTSVRPMRIKMRADEVTDGGYPNRIVANAPSCEDDFFVVPKVVE